MKTRFTHSYDDIISIENILLAWNEFKRGKSTRCDVLEFERFLIKNVSELYRDLDNRSYCHGEYEAFKISDPKPRDIHKASVGDRLVHHAVYRKLYSFFDTTFIASSFSCRKNKGIHRALRAFQVCGNKVSGNNTRTVWVLKCDIRKFFASIDHKILINILNEYINDKEIVCLIKNIVESFHTRGGKGLPLGNLTSQLLVNIYMNEFDQFVKHTLKTKFYIRYADDFVIFSHNKDYLKILLPHIDLFLKKRLKLDLHPQKVSIKTLSSGVDFLGWVHFPDHRVLRTVTKRRMIRNLQEPCDENVKTSYEGLMRYGNTNKIKGELYN